MYPVECRNSADTWVNWASVRACVNDREGRGGVDVFISAFLANVSCTGTLLKASSFQYGSLELIKFGEDGVVITYKHLKYAIMVPKVKKNKRLVSYTSACRCFPVLLILISIKVLNSCVPLLFFSFGKLCWFSDGQLPETVKLMFTCFTPKQHEDHPALLSSFIFKPGPLDKSADLTQCFVVWTIRFHCVGKNAEAITLLETSPVRQLSSPLALLLCRESSAHHPPRHWWV